MIEEIETFINIKDYDAMLNWAFEHDRDDATQEEFEYVVKCYELCMNQGYGVAANNIGAMYYNGRYFKQDIFKAIEYYEAACSMMDQLAFSNLGYCYYYGGDGLDIDYKKAYEVFDEGALLFDDSNCLYKLGDMYRYGYYVSKDYIKAFRLYIRALGCLRENDERDNEITADIRMRLGECFLEGIGTERDVVEALFNLNLAISIFYKYRDNKYIPEDIARCKELIEKAEAILDGKPDVSFKS